MTNLTIEKKEIKKYKIYAFNGELDDTTNNKKVFEPIIKEVETDIENRKENEKLKYIFDFEELTYINSYSIGCICEILEKLEMELNKNEFSIGIVSKEDSQIFDILELIGIGVLIEIKHNISDFLK